MNTFSVSTALRFGWETFKKRPWFLIGAALLVFVLSWIISAIQSTGDDIALWGLLVFLASIAASTFVDMGFTAFFLHTHDDIAKVSLNDLWHPEPFWKYLGASILTSILVIGGLILALVPGLILMTLLAFVKFLVIDRNLGPIAAMKESVRITRGHRWDLFLFFIVIIILNILGAIALLVGLLVTVPVSVLGLAHAYRTLAHTTAGAHEFPHTTQLPHAPHTSSI
ncbi:hypothetical protein HYT05_02490 [Candidatus Kaiserbacteria bacterium]|nr:hypothetical protein [Candidatus Kaiserbacteria bacterium]